MLRRFLIRNIKNIIFIGGAILIFSALGSFATVLVSDSDHYRIDSDQQAVCITGPVALTKYAITYDVAQADLFIPKKTAAEFNSFMDVIDTQGANPLGITGLYSDWQSICSTYDNCNYGEPLNGGMYTPQYNCPGGSMERWCWSPCDGPVQCGGPC